MRRSIAAFLDALLLFWVVAVAPLCWILRDGLGAGSTDSQGLEAIVRFLSTFYWGSIAAAIAIARVCASRRLIEPQPIPEMD